MNSLWLPRRGLDVGRAMSAMVVQSVPASSDDAVALLAAAVVGVGMSAGCGALPSNSH